MKKLFLAAIAVVTMAFSANAQTFNTRTGTIAFDATSALEDITASTSSASGAIQGTTGVVQISVNVKSFHFKRALMEEHFNENYLESEKFPKATFSGQLQGWNAEMLKKDGTQTLTVKGKLTMHGVEREVQNKAVITINGGAIVAANTDFTVAAADYNIAIPSAVKDKIAKTIKVSVKLKDMKKSGK